MKALFIYTLNNKYSTEMPINNDWDIYFGISMIYTVLKEHGHEADLLVLTHESDISVLYNKIEDFKPDMIGFTSVASEYSYVKSLAGKVKEKYPSIYLVLGGVHATIFPSEKMLEIFDAICIGEGEYPILELLEQLAKRATPPPEIKNLWVKQPDGTIKKNPVRDWIENLDELPYIDREVWGKYIDKTNKNITPSIVIGRGCPYLCTYCCNHALRKVANGKYTRYRSPQNIIGEIKTLHKYYENFDSIYFEVETFGADLKWSLEFCDALEAYNNSRADKLKFRINLRVTPSLLKNADHLLKRMADAGFNMINIGLESGSERLRKEILHRNYSNEHIAQIIRLARKYNIESHLYVLIGLPTETVEEYNMTVDFMKENNLTSYYLSIFYPYPGTDLYDFCVKNKFIPHESDSFQERINASINYPQFSKAKIQKAYFWFLFYIRKENDSFDTLYAMMINVYQYFYSSKYKKKFIPLFVFLDAFLPTRQIRPHSGEKLFTLHFLCECFRRYVIRLVKKINILKKI